MNMSKLSSYTDELRWIQNNAKEDGITLNFFQGLWGYKEVALFLGVSPQTVKKPEFRLRLPALSMWQAKSNKNGKAGQQVLRWRPIDVIRWREEREAESKRRVKNPKL